MRFALPPPGSFRFGRRNRWGRPTAEVEGGFPIDTAWHRPRPHSLSPYRREGAVAALILLLAGILAVVEPTFLSAANGRDILAHSAVPAIAAIGMTGLIVAGAIDISVGSQLAVCAVVAGTCARAGWPLSVVALATVASGALLGAANGLLVTWGGIPPIIATLGTMGILRGMMTWVTQGVWIRNLPPTFTALGEGSIAGLPYTVWVALLCALAGAAWLGRTRLGRYAYAVGSNARAARLAGIRVGGVLFLLFVVSGALVGLGALLQASRFTVIQSNMGKGFELQVITAVVVGGTDIFGGRGTVAGSVLGALLLGVGGTALTFLRVPAEWEPTLQGALILAAIVGSSGSRRRRA
jgi:rhamnose transport system permease protein